MMQLLDRGRLRVTFVESPPPSVTDFGLMISREASFIILVPTYLNS